MLSVLAEIAMAQDYRLCGIEAIEARPKPLGAIEVIPTETFWVTDFRPPFARNIRFRGRKKLVVRNFEDLLMESQNWSQKQLLCCPIW